MNYRTLGQTGIEVSEIGFGAWGIGGIQNGAIAYGPTKDQESKRAIQKAFDLGITFYDTADLYGYGHSEKLLGETLKPVRDQVVIASKVGFKDFGGAQDFSAAHIRTSLEASLKRLQTDYVDLYQLHSPPLQILEKEDPLIETLSSLVQAGKVRALGIALRSPEEGRIALEKFDFNAIQLNFNLIDQRALINGLFDHCQKEGIGIIVRTPLCYGFLTGQYSLHESYHAQDHRSGWSSAQINRWSQAFQLFAGNLKEEQPQSKAQIALRFCLSYPSVSTIIPGILTVEQAEENAHSSELGALPSSTLQKFQKTYQEHTFFIAENKSK